MVHNRIMTDKLKKPTIFDSLQSAEKLLQPKKIQCAADKNLGRLEAEILLAHVLKRDRAWLLAHPSHKLKTVSYKLYARLVARRVKHEPIAYILGHKEFYGLNFLVSRDVLIPRPESELLVDLARQKLFHEPDQHDLAWDVGTGCGAIGLSLAKHITPRRVLATDISPVALSLAKKNAKRLNVRNVTFLKANLFDVSTRFLLSRFRPSYKLKTVSSKLVIVANLPYLPTSDKKKLPADVVKFEPNSALFAGLDGMSVIEKFLRQLAAYDILFSSAFLEIDPPQAVNLRRLARELFPHAKIWIHKDLAKRNRVLEISLIP